MILFLFWMTDAQELNTTYYGEPNSTYCFHVGDQQYDLRVAWDQRCMCAVGGIIAGYECGCDSSNIRPSLSESGEICFSDEDFSLNNMLVHFLRTRNPCCGTTNYEVNTILNSYRIIISGKCIVFRLFTSQFFEPQVVSCKFKVHDWPHLECIME